MSQLNPSSLVLSVSESALDSLPLSQRAVIALNKFQLARSENDYMGASSYWSKIRPLLKKYEADVQCKDSGSASDKDLATSFFSDLANVPTGVIFSLTELVLAYASKEKDEEKDELFQALKKAKQEVDTHVYEKAKGKGTELTKDAIEKSLDSVREPLLKYLQGVSKRSRKYFAKIVDSCIGTLKILGGATSVILDIAFSPTKITPEWCGLMKNIENEQAEAFHRIFSSTSKIPLTNQKINKSPTTMKIIKS
jgi:hypothetical protein